MEQSFVQKYWELASGFHLKSVAISEADKDRMLRSSEVWEVLAGVLLSCQSGNFAELPRIPKLLRKNEGFLFWKAAFELIGYAGSWEFIDWFFRDLQTEINNSNVQYCLAISLANSCGLWAVEPLLKLHAAAVEEEPRYQIERHLSYLIEEENDLIWIGAEEEVVPDPDPSKIEVYTIVNYEAFAEEVRNARKEVVDRVGSVSKPVYEGRLFDINDIAKRLYDRLTSEDKTEGRIYRERMILEASTGMDCSSFYDEEDSLQYLPASAIMETFLESEEGSRYEPGIRYFFGHPIPDDLNK